MLRFAAIPFRAANSLRLFAACLIALALTTGACAPRKSVPSSATGNTRTVTVGGKVTGANAVGQQAAPTEFADIPVPKGRKINVDKTMVVGTDVWFGQLTFDTNYSSEAMFTFYTRELPNYGWGKITAVRAQTSFMTYERQNRIMTIAITPNRILGSEVTITVSPRERSKPVFASAPAYAPRNAPAGAPAPGPAPVTGTPLNPPPITR